MFESFRFSAPVLLAILPALADAEVTVIPPVADTCLSEYTADYNFGSQTDFPAGGLGGMSGSLRLTRVLLKFDVAAALPAGAVVTGARMTLHVTVVPQDPRASEFSLNRVLVPWNEGAKSGEIPGGAPATAGETTWNHRLRPDTGWTTPGGNFGVDFSATSSASNPDVDGEGDYIFVFNETGIRDVQEALDQAGENHGWVLWSVSEDLRKTARRWASRESAAGSAPQLEITWTTAPAPEILSIEKSSDGSAFEVRFAALAGFSYQMETSEFLEAWLPGGIITPEADSEQVFTLPIAESTGFLRIRSTTAP